MIVMGKIKKFLANHKVLILIILLALLLRFPWLYTTIEKDEGEFGYVTWKFLSGDNLVSMSTNKPPVLFMLYSTPIYLFGNSIVPVRIFNNILFVISIFFFFKFTKQFFSKKIALFSTLFYAVFMNIPIFEGYLAMPESLLMPFLLISLYSFKKYISSKEYLFLFISSAFAFITVLIKHQAIFLYILLISGLFIYKEKNKIEKIGVLFFPLIVLVGLGIIFLNEYIFLKILNLTFQPFFSGYVSKGYILLIIFEGSLLLLFSIIGIKKVFSKVKLTKNELFIIAFFIFTLIFSIIPPAFGHYYLFLIPSLAIFSGIGIVYVLKTKQDKKLFFFLVIILVVLTGWLVLNHYPDSKLELGSFNYGWSSLKDYNQQILVSEYVKNVTLPEDRILIWGWEPTIYWLSERRNIFPFDYISCDNIPILFFDRILPAKAKNAKVIIFLPDEKRKCDNRTIEIFSNITSDYNEVKIDNVDIYVKKIN